MWSEFFSSPQTLTKCLTRFVGWDLTYFPTYVPVLSPKLTKSQKFLIWGQGVWSTFQLLFLSPKLTKSLNLTHSPMFSEEGVDLLYNYCS